MAVRARDFFNINGFDSDFFAHMEEIDLCWRWKNSGKSILYCSESTVYHVGGGTLDYRSPKKVFLNYRNNLYMIHKNYKGSYPLYLIILIRLFLDQISGFRFVIKGKLNPFFQIYLAHLNYLKNISKIQSKRKNYPKLPFEKMRGVINKFLIWEYFIKNNRIFSKIYQHEA